VQTGKLNHGVVSQTASHSINIAYRSFV